MVFPLLALGTAALGGGLLTSVLTGGKKEEIVQHAPYETYTYTQGAQTYAPSIEYGYVGPTYQIYSPEAVSKKSLSQAASVDPSITESIIPTVGTGDVGADYQPLIIIAGLLVAGVIGYGVISK